MQSPQLRVSPRLVSIALAFILAAAWMTLAPLTPLWAQTCDRGGCAWTTCGVGAKGVPQANWGELQPLDAGALPPERDVTSFYEYTGQYSANPYFFSIDIANGWAFTGMDYGVMVWDVSSGGPVQKSYLSYLSFPFWTAGEQKTPLQDVAVPAGVDTIGAVGGISDIGLSIIDFTSKTSPRLVYQNAFQQVPSVYAATLNGTHYAFGATGGGLLIYNMDAAVRQYGSSPCREDYAPGPGCPGVYVGKVGNSAYYVSGADQYVIVSYAGGSGFDIWDVSNPASPVHKLFALGDRGVHGVAMWKDGATGHYLAAGRTVANGSTAPGTPNQLFILDVDCITGANGCGGVPPVLSTYLDLPDTAAQTSGYFLSFSRSGNTPFLYLGSDEDCGPTNVQQREWLLDVSNPSQPRDITPPTVGGAGYWGWYYMLNPTGFNFVEPRKGKFWGQYFYRAAKSLFDVHKHAGAVAPTPGFTWNPQLVYPGTPVNFVDQSFGQPTSWSWTFSPDGSPASSTAQSPSGVTFATAGAKTVTLKAQNNTGSNSLPQTVTVLVPQPQVASISVSPSAPLQCQPVTLTANSVSGQPPLTWAWAITSGGNPAAGGSSTAANSFVWDTKANGNPAGSYTAKVTINNGTGTPASAQTTFSLGSLATLPASNTFAPTNDPFSNALVQFHVSVAGATEWNWDFGDGAGFTGWTNDPTKGPNPSHTYAAVGTYNVQVQVRNCINVGGSTSSVLPVKVTQITPLIASFQPQPVFGFYAYQAGLPVGFTDSSTGADCWDYDWEGTGTYSDTGHTSAVLSHTYNNPGTFTPALRVHRGGCAGTEQNTTTAHAVIINPAQPATISVSGPSSGTPNTAYTFAASAQNCTPAASWSWSAPGGTINGAATGSSISVTYASTGTYSVSASNSGCTPAIGSANIAISNGGGGGGGGGGGLQASFNYSPAAPKVGDTVSFDGTATTGATGYSWDFGDGNSGGGVTTTHVYANPGTYTAKLDATAPGTGPGCLFGTCVSEATKSVTVGSNVTVANSDFSSSGGCANSFGLWTCQATALQPYTLTAAETNPAANFSWDFGDNSTGTGSQVTHSWQTAGSYPVKLTVSGKGLQSSTTTKTFIVAAPKNPLANSDFDSSDGCTNVAGFGTCQATSGAQVKLTGKETTAGASFAWDFGDNTTGSGSPVNHTWPSAGDYPVKLTVSGPGLTTTSTTKTFQVRAPEFQSVVLPWVSATHGALVQSCDLYLHNPSANPVDMSLQFLKRGTPDTSAPRSTSTVPPGATFYAPNVLQSVFNRDSITGFLMVTVKSTDPLPVITSYNTVVRGDGAQFGQTIPGLVLPNSTPPSGGSTPPASTFQYLVGLNSNSNEVSYFGITNPNPVPATYHVRLLDNLGSQIGESNGDLIVGPFGQRQFQAEDVHNLFGLGSASDYLVSIEDKTAGTVLFPFGENVRQGSGDPSFITAGGTAAATQYVLGAFSTNGSWQSDVVLTNTSTQPMNLSLTFTRIGFFAGPTAAVNLTLAAGQTERLSNAIAGQWNLNNVVGVITVTSSGAGGIFPIVQAESYNNAQPANRYGQSMRAFTDLDAATAGHTHYLVGLRQDGAHLTTFWVFNNSTTQASAFDVVYRALDGTVLGTVSNAALPPGRVRQFLPNQHLLPNGGVIDNGFTVQVVVKQGSVITAGQVLTNSTGDPAYVQGAPR